jgi:hypothetical protein
MRIVDVLLGAVVFFAVIGLSLQAVFDILFIADEEPVYERKAARHIS